MARRFRYRPLPSVYGGGNASLPENSTSFTGGATGRTAATNQYFLGATTNYNSLQVQLTKRYSAGLSFTSAFTWGKVLNYATGGDDNGTAVFFINFRKNYAPADFDRAKNFEQSFTYELPAGRNHKYFNSGVGDAVFGKWRLTGVISLLSGLPFSVWANQGALNTPGTQLTANISGSPRVLHNIGPGKQWLDNSNFSQPAGCAGAFPCPSPALGNTGRNQFRGPGYWQNNFSLAKKFTMYRELASEIRIDAVQLTNSPQFALPNAGTAANSGSIFTASNFGQITGTLGSGQGTVNGVGGGRSLQGSIRVSF